MTQAIFLSAGVPDQERGPEFARTADTVAITAAVSALVHVVLGRRILVWGGHPAITPMIWAVSEGYNVDYGRWVKLYQSRRFEDEYPEDNQRFQNVTYTEDVNRDRAQSLELMRRRMLSDHSFEAAVFIGGMDGVVDEFELVRKTQPKAKLVPVVSTGGAALSIARDVRFEKDLSDDLNYVALFHKHLGVPYEELRFESPAAQPPNVRDRLWRREPKD